MPRLTLATLGVRVKEKRGPRKLREVAKEIGISPATLMRIKNGRARPRHIRQGLQVA